MLALALVIAITKAFFLELEADKPVCFHLEPDLYEVSSHSLAFDEDSYSTYIAATDGAFLYNLTPFHKPVELEINLQIGEQLCITSKESQRVSLDMELKSNPLSQVMTRKDLRLLSDELESTMVVFYELEHELNYLGESAVMYINLHDKLDSTIRKMQMLKVGMLTVCGVVQYWLMRYFLKRDKQAYESV